MGQLDEHLAGEHLWIGEHLLEIEHRARGHARAIQTLHPMTHVGGGERGFDLGGELVAMFM